MTEMGPTWEDRWPVIRQTGFDVLTGDITLPPIYILSHARLDIPTLKAIPFLEDRPELTIVVPEERLLDYYEEWPGLDIIAVPENYEGVGRGVAQARQFVLDTAKERGQNIIVMLDDDITGVSMMYQGADGKASSAHVKQVGEERPLYSLGVMARAIVTCVGVMHKHPEVVLAGPQNRNDQRTLDAALSKYDLNYGRMPIGFVVWHVKRFREMCSCLDMAYNRHGEDLWATMSVLHQGGMYARVPSVLVSFYDEHTQSTLKSPENEKAVRNAEGERVAEEPWYDRLRIKRYPDGSYHGGAPNMKKFRDTAPFLRVQWTGERMEKPVVTVTAAEPREGVTMKVNVNEQIEISDEQRFMLGAVLTGQQKPKYFAKRDEIKSFVWEHGANWASDLEDAHADRFQAERPVLAEDDVDDLLGDDEDDGLI